MIAMCSHVKVPFRAFFHERCVTAIQVPRVRSICAGQLAHCCLSLVSLARQRNTFVNVYRSLGQRSASRCSRSKRRRLKSWPTTVIRVGYAPVSSRKRATENSTFWNKVERRIFNGHSRRHVRRREKTRRAREAQVRFALGRCAERRSVAPG